MKRYAAAAFAVGVLAVAGPAQDAADAAKKIAGTYTVVSLSEGGRESNKDTSNITFVITGDTITITDGDRKKEAARFRLDPSKSPAHIDLKPTPDKTMLGIYQTKATKAGLELTIAFTKDEQARPKDFATDNADGIVVKLLRPAAK